MEDNGARYLGGVWMGYPTPHMAAFPLQDGVLYGVRESWGGWFIRERDR
jgi:hypothetical protein